MMIIVVLYLRTTTTGWRTPDDFAMEIGDDFGASPGLDIEERDILTLLGPPSMDDIVGRDANPPLFPELEALESVREEGSTGIRHGRTPETTSFKFCMLCFSLTFFMYVFFLFSFSRSHIMFFYCDLYAVCRVS